MNQLTSFRLEVHHLSRGGQVCYEGPTELAEATQLLFRFGREAALAGEAARIILTGGGLHARLDVQPGQGIRFTLQGGPETEEQ